MNRTKETQSNTGDATKMKKQRSSPTRKINHWWTKRIEPERRITSIDVHYRCLPMFTEGREKKIYRLTDDGKLATQ